MITRILRGRGVRIKVRLLRALGSRCALTAKVRAAANHEQSVPSIADIAQTQALGNTHLVGFI